jgi:leader peptidase (prepilin peptidase)/N-methyltransferase
VTASPLFQVWGFSFLILAGLTVGSFLNVCVYRVPRGLSIVRPRSFCPRCHAPVRARHNIPVLSWLWLRGRCADCGGPISPRYPLVEAATAAVWALAGVRFGLTIELLIFLPFFSALIVLFFTDWDERLLPDRVTLPLAILGLALSPWNPRLDCAPGFLGSGDALGRLASSTLGAALGFGVFLALALGWKLLFRREAMGGGDLKLMLGVGAFLGMSGVLVTTFLGSFAGSLLSLPFLLRGRWNLRRELPFGCFLAPAAAFAAFFGVEVLRWYMGLLLPVR